jgi:hypothetical protein
MVMIPTSSNPQSARRKRKIPARVALFAAVLGIACTLSASALVASASGVAPASESVEGRAGTLVEAARGEPAVAADWVEVFADNGRDASKFDENWHVWGTHHTITHSKLGMRVQSGPTYSDADRVALFAKVEVGTPDLRVQYDYTKNDTFCGPVCPANRTGLASMILLSIAGTGTTIPLDPTTTTVAAPSLALINQNLDGLRVTYSTAWNEGSPSLNNQVRLHLVPGNIEVAPSSTNDFFFTPGVTYRVIWEKVADTLSVSVTNRQTGEVLTHSFTHPGIAAKAGKRVALYQMPIRDATYAHITIWERKLP